MLPHRGTVLQNEKREQAKESISFSESKAAVFLISLDSNNLERLIYERIYYCAVGQ